MKAKSRVKSSERWRRADHHFALATIALMIFFLAAGFTAWIFGHSSSAAVDLPGVRSDLR
jgi:hypothetical protein